MTFSEMLEKVKNDLKIKDDTRDLDISDVILSACEFCHLNRDELPELLEPFIRKKVKVIIDYEAAKGTGYQQDISGIKDGDGSITYATGGSRWFPELREASSYTDRDVQRNRSAS